LCYQPARARRSRQQGKPFIIIRQSLQKNPEQITKAFPATNWGSSIPPADALKNIADALGVSSDALLNDNTIAIKDKDSLKKFEAIQDMNEEDKALVTRFLDLIIRDFNARKAYK